MEKQSVTPSEKDIAKCKEEKKTMLIQSRNAIYKQDILSGAIWTLLFFILMMVHYPRFMKQNQKD